MSVFNYSHVNTLRREMGGEYAAIRPAKRIPVFSTFFPLVFVMNFKVPNTYYYQIFSLLVAIYPRVVSKINVACSLLRIRYLSTITSTTLESLTTNCYHNLTLMNRLKQSGTSQQAGYRELWQFQSSSSDP